MASLNDPCTSLSHVASGRWSLRGAKPNVYFFVQDERPWAYFIVFFLKIYIHSFESSRTFQNMFCASNLCFFCEYLQISGHWTRSVALFEQSLLCCNHSLQLAAKKGMTMGETCLDARFARGAR